MENNKIQNAVFQLKNIRPTNKIPNGIAKMSRFPKKAYKPMHNNSTDKPMV
jgi:hypothetical protein